MTDPDQHSPRDAGHRHNAPADADPQAIPVRAAPATLDVRLQRGAAASLIALIVLCVLWETVLSPLRPGGSWLVLKVLPLCIPLAGLLKNRMYTYRWVSLMVWLYFTEGVVRAWSDTAPLGRALAGIEVLLCLMLFTACAMHVRLRLRDARTARAAVPLETSTP